MDTLQSLAELATRTALAHRHHLGPFRSDRHGLAAYATCQDCLLAVFISTVRQAPRIQGLAVQVRCRAGVSELAAGASAA